MKPRRSSQEMAVSEDWGIPGLEIASEDLRATRGERASSDRRSLAAARRRVVNAMMPEVLDKAESVRARVWTDYQKAVREGRRQERGGAPGLRALQMLARARKLRDRLEAEIEAQLNQAAARIEERTIDEPSARRPEALAPIIRQALEKGLRVLGIALNVHPDELKRIEALDPKLHCRLDEARIDLRSDPGVRSGSCVVETEAGSIEAGVAIPPEQIALLLLLD